ncbi:MAG: hypothetical protein K0R54_2257 [Clostridiaceae bacterium]|jgi:hypothetical protein|nr:hypothetical protein [Clostridiaceae bacterium]
MDHENFMYLNKKVVRYEQLQSFKEHLNDFQQELIKDKDIRIAISDDDYDKTFIADNMARKSVCIHIKDEYDELMREIKDNLIDSIGMTLVKINQIMEEI